MQDEVRTPTPWSVRLTLGAFALLGLAALALAASTVSSLGGGSQDPLAGLVFFLFVSGILLATVLLPLAAGLRKRRAWAWRWSQRVTVLATIVILLSAWGASQEAGEWRFRRTILLQGAAFAALPFGLWLMLRTERAKAWFAS